MGLLLAAGHVDGCGAGVAGVVLLVREASDVAGEGEDLRGGEEPDALDLSQGGAARGNCCPQLLLWLLDRRLMTLEVAHHVTGDLPSLLVGCRHRADLGQQSRGVDGVEAHLGAPGMEVTQQHVEPVDPARVLGDQVFAALGEQTHDPSRRARAASFAGTSRTNSPALISCWAMPRPSPVAPSTAHWRSGHWVAQVSSAAGVLLSTTSRIGGWGWPSGPTATAVKEILCGSMPIVITS